MDFDEKMHLMKNKGGELNGRKRTTSFNNRGLSVTWTNLSVTAEQKKNSIFKQSTSTFKGIIREVSGAVEASTLVAILGASGSGKSTLMSVLANRAPRGLHIDGDIRIGRKPIGWFVKYVSGFVYQDDLFIPNLTVLEHLEFIAKLRLDRDIAEKDRKRLIYDVLKELGLTEISNRRIADSSFGNEKMNLSGGERKRLSVATELVTDPSLLFCDEPTTGLDASTAVKVVLNLKHLVTERQKTVICSIHQPNDEIFSLFDRIILITEGKIAFCGNSNEALEFFMSQGYSSLKNQNPADYFVKILAKVEDKKADTNQLCSVFENSTYYSKMMRYIDKEHQNKNNENPSMYHITKCEGPPWFIKLWYVTYRNNLNIIRDFSIQYIRILQKLFIGTVLGVCMRGSISATQTGIQALNGVLFTLVAENFTPVIFTVLAHVRNQMPIFFREYANSTNTSFIFYLANVFSLLPGYLLDPLPFTAVVYWLTLRNLQPELWSWILTYLITALLLNISAAFGMLLSMTFSDIEMAETCIAFSGIVCATCSGVFLKISSIPIVFKWINYVSWFAYAFESLFLLHSTGFDTIECPENIEVPCLRNRSEVLASLSFDDKNLLPNIYKMLGIYFILHVFAYLALLSRIRRRKI